MNLKCHNHQASKPIADQIIADDPPCMSGYSGRKPNHFIIAKRCLIHYKGASFDKMHLYMKGASGA